MTHDDWLYLIEFFTKRNQLADAESVVKAMKSTPPDLSVPRQRIKDAGFTSYYL